MKYIVDIETGTILYPETCVLVDDHDIQWDSEEGFMEYAEMNGIPVLNLRK